MIYSYKLIVRTNKNKYFSLIEAFFKWLRFLGKILYNVTLII